VIFHSTDFTKIKGTEFLFRAMPIVKKNVPNVKLLISTTLTNKRVKQTLLNYAKINGFADNIEFLGFLDYKLMPIYLSLADVVVQPSIGQSMNLTIKESMSCGTPVVTSLEGSEQFKDSTAGYLVDPEKTSELGDKIVRLLKNKDLGEKMGVKGRNIIRSKFSWGAVYRKIDGVIKETANQ
jgi:glycosyltransferase involved in cell wall biosynthesis